MGPIAMKGDLRRISNCHLDESIGKAPAARLIDAAPSASSLVAPARSGVSGADIQPGCWSGRLIPSGAVLTQDDRACLRSTL